MALSVAMHPPRPFGHLGLLAAAALVLVLTGCSSSQQSGSAQVIDGHGSAPVRQPASGGQYIVQRGDTLYSIAFRFGWDWKALAARNRIGAPYVIRPGQVIRFDQAGGQVPMVAKAAPSVGNAKPVAMPPPVRPVVPVVAPVITNTPAKPAIQTAPPANVPLQKSASGWVWPASGALIGRYSSNGSLNKGIDIAGNLGQPVLAASSGSVVYAGSGLRGYGELVIIKHSDTYVSAYGHNRRLLVREGQQVKVGQAIAEMGSTGTDRVKLHFEIRRQGKPVDPLQYLPKR